MFCFDFCHKACGIPAPQPGTEPSPPELEGKVLTTELPRKSPTACFKMTKLITFEKYKEKYFDSHIKISDFYGDLTVNSYKRNLEEEHLIQLQLIFF